MIRLAHEQTGPNFPATFSFCEFVSTCKKWGCFTDLFWRKRWFKNPTILLTEGILTYISEQYFSQILDLCRNTESNTNFHYITNSVNINDQIFLKFNKPYFGLFLVHFSSFGGKNVFSKKSPPVTHNTFIRVSSNMPKFRNSNGPIPRKHWDRWQDGRTDRLYFIAPFQLPAGVKQVQLQ